MKKGISIFLFLLCAQHLSAQHLPVFSEYAFNPVVLNPADAGYRKALDVSIMHRRQWVGFDGAPVTTSLLAHTALHNQKMNLGISILADAYGVTSKTQVKGYFAYRIFTQKNQHLSFGISAAVNQISNRWSDVNTTVGGDPIFVSGNDRLHSSEFGFGLMYRTKKIALGLATPVLFSPGSSGQEFSLQYLLSAQYHISLGKDFVATPFLAVRHIQNSPAQFDISGTLDYREKISFGIGYRKNAALMFISKFKINEQLEAGYAYDLTLSRLRTHSNGSHEILVRYLFFYKTGTRRVRV